MDFPKLYEYIGDNYTELVLCSRHVLARRRAQQRMLLIGVADATQQVCLDCQAEKEAAETKAEPAQDNQ